jgi:aspartate/glutamate racemase
MKIASPGSVARSGAKIDGLRDIAHSLIDQQGVETIILVGTELSLAFNEIDRGFPAVDCARVHIDAILVRALGEASTS